MFRIKAFSSSSGDEDQKKEQFPTSIKSPLEKHQPV
jgi:hypothetical protein